jgi:hypothetical protein
MATSSSNSSERKPATTRATTRKSTSTRKPSTSARRTATSARKTAASARTTAKEARTTARSTAASASRKASSSNSTQPKTPVALAQEIAERAVLVPVGASLLARDNLASTVKGIATKYRTRASLEREIKRYERRGATARNRFERQVRKTRTRFERELRQRRTRVERTVKQNRRRFEREARTVRKDFGKQSGQLTSRVERIVSDAQGRITSAL